MPGTLLWKTTLLSPIILQLKLNQTIQFVKTNIHFFKKKKRGSISPTECEKGGCFSVPVLKGEFTGRALFSLTSKSL